MSGCAQWPAGEDLTEQLRRWGRVHAQARAAERMLAGPASAQAHQEARRLREAADGLHREIYRRLDRLPCHR